jgi:hypothetical protein
VTSPIRERVADAALAEEAGWDRLFVWDQLIGYNKDLWASSPPPTSC